MQGRRLHHWRTRRYARGIIIPPSTQPRLEDLSRRSSINSVTPGRGMPVDNLETRWKYRPTAGHSCGSSLITRNNRRRIIRGRAGCRGSSTRSAISRNNGVVEKVGKLGNSPLRKRGPLQQNSRNNRRIVQTIIWILVLGLFLLDGLQN